ncbi:MAG: hypothetical protein PHD88_09745 [Firmicutes bacterium]|nr:hypothetical protein [Bacillota bacterium]MDD4694644.1 hypothetical protein [Bacillota bacterium]
MKKLLLALCIFTFLTLAISADLLIEPSRIIVEIEPGGKTSGAISIINTGKKPLDLKAVLYDWDLEETSELIELEAGLKEDSLDNLIKFNPREFTILPGKSQVVRYTIQAPDDSLEHKGIVFFEQTITPPKGSMIGATVKNKIGTIFYVSTPLIEMDITFEDISLSSENGNHFLKVVADNTGKGHIRLIISYLLQTKEGKTLKEETLPDQVLLVGKKLNSSFPIIGDLAPGNYRLIVNLSYSGYTQRNQGVLEFSIP